MITSTSRYETPNASKYLQALCKHFGHKVTVEYDSEKGQAALPPGPASFLADGDGLNIKVTGEDEKGIQVAQYIVEDHLKRFAFRENPEALTWTTEK